MSHVETISITEATFSGPSITDYVAPPGSVFTRIVLEEPRMMPDRISYAARVHPGLRTTKPFSVQFSKIQNGFTASVADIEEFGIGGTRSEALDDLGHTLAELYFSLDRDAARLSDDLLSVFGKLQMHLSPIPR